MRTILTCPLSYFRKLSTTVSTTVLTTYRDIISHLTSNIDWSQQTLLNTQKQIQAQQTVTHNNKKAAHGHACEADWDYLAYSEPEARLFLSRAISILFVLSVDAAKAFDCPESHRFDQTTTMYDTTIHHCPPKTKGRHRGHGRSHHGRTRG